MWNKKKILLVDDDVCMCQIISARLQHANYEVEVVHRGEDAIQKMSKKTPKLVLLDIVMPGIDGFQVLERMKSDRRMKSVPVIMITSKSENADVQRAVGMGAKDYIVKPFNPAVLLEKVRKEIGAK